MYPVDENGIPGAMGDDRFFDGGDSAAIVGTIEACGGETVGLDNFITNFGPVRHPDSSKWYGKLNRFSRDQLIPLICAGIYNGKYAAIDYLCRMHKRKWFMTAWNRVPNYVMDEEYTKFPDICGPEVWALWIRYKYPQSRVANFSLQFLDVQTFIGAVQWRLLPKNQLTRNHMLVSLVLRDCQPTIFGWLVWKINDWAKLIGLWSEHCRVSYEYDTTEYFQYALNEFQGPKPMVFDQVYKTRGSGE